MREHDGIIKVESPLVKSMDEQEIPEVALRLTASVYTLQNRLS
jgi:hypothetical protein